MRLINTTTGQLEEFIGGRVPPYAALSHTWGDSEVTFQEWSCQSAAPGTGRDKIAATCSLAARDGLGYAWADTCCIDKTSSAELGEAINSMYAWYAGSAACYVYLEDLDPADADADADAVAAGDFTRLEAELPRCRWFTRGWTLQELIAPAHVVFFDRTWTARADKATIVDLLARITGVGRGVLSHAEPLAARPAAEKMSWAARRRTTRVEDAAYCLLGIFGIHMPLVYGEQERAFRRLQEEIIRTTSDLSIFAWQLPLPPPLPRSRSRSPREEAYSGFLASSPAAFAPPCRITSMMPFGHREEFSVTNCGVKTARVRIYLHISAYSHDRNYLFPVDWHGRGQIALGVRVRKCGSNRYVRADPYALVAVDSRDDLAFPVSKAEFYLLTDLPPLPSPSPARTMMTGSGSHQYRQYHHYQQQQQQQQQQQRLMTRAQVLALRGPVMQFLASGLHRMVGHWPEARCDPGDNVFFTAGSPWQDSAFLHLQVWAAVGGDGRGSPPRREDSVVPRGPTFGVACLAVGWGSPKRPPQVSIVASNVNDDGGGGGGGMKKLLKGVWRKDFDTAQLLRHLRFEGVPRLREVRFAVGDGRQVRVSYELTLVEDRAVCEDRFWRLTLTSETRPAGERSSSPTEAAVVEGWVLDDEDDGNEEEDESRGRGRGGAKVGGY
ncbi:hypothetical protein V2A60_000035 [Cordyceps javanica]